MEIFVSVKSTILFSIIALLPILTSSAVNDDAFKNSLQTFSHNIFHELIQSHRKTNLIYSPFCIQTCLTMARLGAEGETAQEMHNALGYTPEQTEDAVADNYFGILDKYENSSILTMANKIYVADGHEINDQYNEVISKKFLSDLESLDFSQSKKAASTINDWIASKTNNRINDVISAKSLTSSTRMILLSAIYFKGEWEKPFLERKTKNRLFYINETDSVEVPTMHNMDKYIFGKFNELNAKGIRLNYKDSDLSMLILLPNDRHGLAAMEEKLKDIDLNTLTQNMKEERVYITLPKFKVKFDVNLESTLRKIGMNGMFEIGGFGKMLKSSEHMVIYSVLHSAFIEINESGTEAAATTGLSAVAVSLPSMFRADHPFHYMILNADNTILFQGNIVSF